MKITLTKDDGSVVELVEASAVPTETVHLAEGAVLEVIADPETPAQEAAEVVA